MKSQASKVTIADVTMDVDRRDPKVGNANEFTYIDISSIDQTTKQITGADVLLAADAPGRARQLVKYNDVLVSTVRPNLNAVARIEKALDGATASTGFAVLRCNPDYLIPSYLYHWVRTPEFINEMIKQATGASYPAVTEKKVKSSRLPLPPLKEQERIAAILDAADQLRTKRQQTFEKVELLKEAIFFKTVNPYLKGPLIPLKEFVEKVVVGHVGPTSEHFSETGVPFLRTGNIGLGKIIDKDLRHITESFHAKLKKSALRSGDVLISRVISDEIRAAAVPADLDGANCANVIIVRPGHSLKSSFLLGMIRLPITQATLLGRRVGSAQSVVNTKVLQNWQIPSPPFQVLEELDGQLSTLDSIADSHAASLKEHNALFDSLQQRAFRGDL